MKPDKTMAKVMAKAADVGVRSSGERVVPASERIEVPLERVRLRGLHRAAALGSGRGIRRFGRRSCSWLWAGVVVGVSEPRRTDQVYGAALFGTLGYPVSGLLRLVSEVSASVSRFPRWDGTCSTR